MSAPLVTSVAVVTWLLVRIDGARPDEYLPDCGLGLPDAHAFYDASLWPDSAALLRDRLRARVEALEAGVSYDEVLAASPTGVAFVRPTRIR